MAFSFTTLERKKGAHLLLKGYVDQKAAKAIREKCQELLEAGWANLLLDFTDVPLVNSAALGEFIELVSQALENGNLHFFIAGLTPTCTGTFRIVGIFHCAQVFETRQDAVRALDSL